MRVALSIGDPNGIGPEITVKAAARRAQGGPGPVPLLVGDVAPVRHYLGLVAPELPLALGPGEWRDDGVVNLMPVPSLPDAAFLPGEVTAAAGAATVAYLKAAVALVRGGQATAIVGAPHNETAIAAAGIPFSGYPGLIAELTGVGPDEVFLMLVGGGLRIVHVTLHERLAGALARLTPGLVIAAAQAAARTLRAFGIADPRIGVFGINPHAGEGGLFGPDDTDITEPAVTALRGTGLRVDGPTGADVLLAAREMDAYVAIFHDQGHIPVKLLAPRRASALSIGAEVLFSSVGHGSAHDIAGQGIADPGAVIETLGLIAGMRPEGR